MPTQEITLPGVGDLRDPLSQQTDERAGLRAAVAQKLGAGAIALPLLPQVANQVLALTSQPRVDALQLSNLIHRDPSLAGQVLRIANSPAYMPSMPIVSLQQAVARLGMETVTEIVLAASLQSGTFKVPGYEAELKRLWRHGLASGIFAKEIARLLRSNVESAFLCGLLHAVGKPALLQVIADAQRERAKTTAASVGNVTGAPLAALLDEFHMGVGLRIAASWALPQPVLNAISFYARFESATAGRREAAVACLSDLFATDLGDPQPTFDEDVRRHAVVPELNLYPSDLAQLFAKRASVARTVESMTL